MMRVPNMGVSARRSGDGLHGGKARGGAKEATLEDNVQEVQDGGKSLRYHKGMEFKHADDGRNRLFCTLSDKAYEKLNVHALKFGCGVSELLDVMCCKELNLYTVSDRTGFLQRRSEGQANRVNNSDETSPITETLRPSPDENESPQAGEGEGVARAPENGISGRRRRQTVP